MDNAMPEIHSRWMTVNILKELDNAFGLKLKKKTKEYTLNKIVNKLSPSEYRKNKGINEYIKTKYIVLK